MKVTFVGELNVELLAKKLLEVIENTAIKVQTENEGVKIKGFGIHEADVTVKFDVEGMDDPQLLTVEHHQGHPEVLQWIVNVDEDTMASNEKESMYDEYTVAKANGQDLNFKEIESLYRLIDLEEESREEYSDMHKVVYNHVDGFKVVKVFQHRKLIQEYKLVPKEETVNA